MSKRLSDVFNKKECNKLRAIGMFTPLAVSYAFTIESEYGKSLFGSIPTPMLASIKKKAEDYDTAEFGELRKRYEAMFDITRSAFVEYNKK